jgi:hypothetical protein
MVANVAEGRSADKPSQAWAVRKRVPSARRPTPRWVAVMAGLLLLPLGTILLTGVPLLHASGWTGAALVVSGASVLTAGMGLVAGPAHAEHVRSRRGVARPKRKGRDDAIDAWMTSQVGDLPADLFEVEEPHGGEPSATCTACGGRHISGPYCVLSTTRAQVHSEAVRPPSSGR